MRTLFTTFCLLLQVALAAQSSALRQASQAMTDLDYVTAILLYQQILEKKDVPEAKINLAECYRKINDAENAEYWYGEVVRLPEARPLHRLYYGMMLQANGKCDQAKKWFEQYSREAPDDLRGQNLLKACNAEAELRNKSAGMYSVCRLPFNSNLDDFSPAIFKNKLIFASDRDNGGAVRRVNMWTGNPFTKLYSLDFEVVGNNPANFRFGRPEQYSEALKTKFHEAAVSFAPDGQTIYFTRNGDSDSKSEEGLLKLKTFYASFDGKQQDWTNLTPLPFNSDEYSVAHPSISADGQQLFFASNRPGGYGGMDLYVSAREDGRWGIPLNLGPVVNTEGNEIFPFVDANRRLYFASNSHIGLGGLDIFYTEEKTPGNWGQPVNVGAPVNSTHDDFGMVFGGDLSWGFFSSDREGGSGRDDLYGFQKTAMPVEILVADAHTRQPLAGAVLGNERLHVTALSTDAGGKITLDMRPGDCSDFTVEKAGYNPVLKRICTENAAAGEVLRVEILLEQQANYTVQGIVFDMNYGLPAENARVTLLNDCGVPLPEAFITRADGRYHFELARNCCYNLKVVADGYFAGTAEKLCTHGLAAGTAFKVNLNLQPYLSAGSLPPVNTPTAKPFAEGALPKYNENTGRYEDPEGRPANLELGNGLVVKNGILFDHGTPSLPERSGWVKGPTGDGFLLHIYYDFDQTEVRSESMSELLKLLKTLQNNPEFQVEIASHTDARGSDAYNLQLSQRRADAVVDWLARNGISRERLSARGYGESRPVNECGNDTPCTEEEYQQNRRTEFHILGQQNRNKMPAAPKRT